MTLVPQSIQDCLLSGERVVWSGQPIQGVRLFPRDLFLVPFSLIWGGFAIFWESSVLAQGAPPIFLLFGSVFAVAGLFMILGRFFIDARIRANTDYAVTDRRALIVRSGFFSNLQSVDLDTLGESSLDPRDDGRGTITFGGGSGPSLFNRSWDQWRIWVPALDPRPQFLAVEDAKHLYTIIQNHGVYGGGHRRTVA